MTATPQPIEMPTNGEPFTLAPGQAAFRHYDVDGTEEMLLHVVVEQLGVDVTVRLLDPEGAEMIAVDSPIGDQGEEELVAILEHPGRYRVEVAANKPEASGRCALLRHAEPRPAADDDRLHVGADRAHRLGWQHHKEQTYGQALTAYREALDGWEVLDLPRREAETLDGMAQTYGHLKQREVAVVLLDRASERLAHLPSAHDRLRRALFLDRAGVLHRRYLGQPARAIADYLEPALELAQAHGGVGILAGIHTHLGRAYQDLGQLQPAADAYNLALANLGAGVGTTLRFQLLMNKTTTLLALHALGEAHGAASEALTMARQVDDPDWVARARLQIATVEARLGLLDQAEASLSEVRSNLSLLRYPYPVNALHAQADIQRRQGQLVAAQETLAMALSLAQEQEDPSRVASILVEMGHLASQQGNAERGLELIDRASVRFNAQRDRLGQAAAHARAAEALVQLSRLDDAWDRIQKALDLIEAQRSVTVRQNLRMGFFAFRQEYYDIALGILVQRWQAEPTAGSARAALNLHERRLARERNEKLLWATSDTASTTDSPHLRTIRGSLREVLFSPTLAETERTTRLDHLLRELDAARNASRREQPRAPETPPAPDLDHLRQVLDDDTLLLVFAVGADNGVVWSFGPDMPLRLDVIPAGRDQLAKQVADWRTALLSSRKSGTIRRDRGAAELGRLLWTPVADRLGHRRLVIVPDGPLLGLPFAALHEPRYGPRSADADPHVPRYLLMQHEIVVMPSLAAIVGLRRSRDPMATLRPAAIFTDPVFTAGDDRVGKPSGASRSSDPSLGAGSSADLERAVTRSGRDWLPRLDASPREAEAILQRLAVAGSLHATGFAASRETLESQRLSDFGLIHFATHAIGDVERPELSGIVLSMIDKSGAPQDGFIRAFEIEQLALDADLVVLSGCETAHGRRVRGEGMLGLARAFLDAGSRRVVASLWQVSDQRTADLMTRFYKRLLDQHHAPSSALRHAQLDLLANPATNHPFYWAGFTFQGDWHPIAGY